MNDYTFTLRFTIDGDDLDSLSLRVYDRIEDASLMGPDDDGTFLIEFDRQAPEFAPAVIGAVNELRAALPEAVILRLEGDDLATMADIAKRAGRTDESVRLLIAGKRGPGGFPPAAGRFDARTRLWRWADVARWFDQALREPLPDAADVPFIQALNDVLDLARIAPELPHAERVSLSALLPVAIA